MADQQSNEIINILRQVFSSQEENRMTNMENRMTNMMTVYQQEFSTVVQNQEEMKLNLDTTLQELGRRLSMWHDVHQLRLSVEDMQSWRKETTERSNFLTGKVMLIVCGGHDGDAWLNSVESFDWQINAWKHEAKMTTKRCGAAAFVCGGDMFVGGGSTDGSQLLETVERCRYKERLEWVEINIKNPLKCVGHGVVVFGQKIFMTGGNSSSNPPQVSNEMYSMSMKSPFTIDKLRNMPESKHDHGSVIIDDKVLVFGGRTSNDNIQDSVYAYSIASAQWRTLSSLPYPVSEMAVVSYKGYAILIGGVLANGEVLNKVWAYNANTGEFQWLPSLNHRRYGCCSHRWEYHCCGWWARR
ncbi:kelch-like protein 20 [Xenia sp. Carnegie-2017]|uniref:kelch-like protein 20 n=1 Tax=Xenia sp. Carnegie-2017 TaxID=2897299 RepID=UPI001F037633|nr:kelch-like protein 20 [Xenia sp. Carnegie-2017]